MEAAGIEPATNSPGNSTDSAPGGAKSGALDADLAVIIDTWPTLPETIRADVLALVRRARGCGSFQSFKVNRRRAGP